MSFVRGVIIDVLVTACVLGSAGPSAAAQRTPIDDEQVRGVKRVTALQITEPIVVDGALDETAWQRADVAKDFIQQQPDEGAPTTEPSEVRILFDRDTLYVGGRFFDSDPRGGITNELKRDFSARDGDLITVVLDTFHDLRSAFGFMINPAGAQRDSQSSDDGRQINADWDGIWEVKTARFEGGWTMEMAIPFNTLRFNDAEEQTWGINIFRLIRRKNEVTLWSPIPRQFLQFKMSYAGVLVGLRDIHPGRNLRIKPFATSGVTIGADGTGRRHPDGGLDVKYGIGPALTLDLTYRTDFSQVEADAQQINLTRFALFLPEKRDFFLENQGSFRVGDVDQLTGARSPLVSFFSRRIGLDSSGNLMPIVGGAKLSGQSGPYNIGILNMQTESGVGTPASNFTVARVAREIGTGSSASAFYLGRESSGADPFNRIVGGDLHLNFKRAIDVDGFALESSATNNTKGVAGRAAVNVTENLYKVYAAYTNVTPAFRNDLGFVPRSNIGLFEWEAEKNLRPHVTARWVRNYAVGTEGTAHETSAHDRLVSRMARVDTSVDFSDGGRFAANIDTDYESLTAPFQISKGVVLPPGVYRFRQFVPTYTSDASRPVSGSVTATTGEFYDGTIRGASGSLRVRVDQHFAAAATYAYNHVVLREGEFTAQLLGIRADHSFSTRQWLNAFIQYNQVAGTWFTNIRYRYMYRPLSDVFVVFNETRTAGQRPQRAVIAKYTLLLAF